MNRFTQVHIGWPEKLLGKILHAESSSATENFAVICYEDEKAEHGFLVFEQEKIGQITQSWLNGKTGDQIEKEFIHA